MQQIQSCFLSAPTSLALSPHLWRPQSRLSAYPSHLSPPSPPRPVPQGSPRHLITDATLPLLSFFSGASIEGAVRAALGDAAIEDFWLRFFCVTTNLSSGQLEVHERRARRRRRCAPALCSRPTPAPLGSSETSPPFGTVPAPANAGPRPRCSRRGPASRFVRAAMSILGLLPPVNDGQSLLVDGGYLNNVRAPPPGPARLPSCPSAAAPIPAPSRGRAGRMHDLKKKTKHPLARSAPWT